MLPHQMFRRLDRKRELLAAPAPCKGQAPPPARATEGERPILANPRVLLDFERVCRQLAILDPDDA